MQSVLLHQGKGYIDTQRKNPNSWLGFNQIDPNPYYDAQTEQADKQIQQAYGLDPDGIVGPLTKIVLFNEKKSLKIPHIAYKQIDPH